jgi:COP9 signalosome complex subunit 6
MWRQAKPSASQLTGQPGAEEAGRAVSLRIEFITRRICSYQPCSVESHLQTQRSAVKMLHERIVMLIKYATDVIAGEHP